MSQFLFMKLLFSIKNIHSVAKIVLIISTWSLVLVVVGSTIIYHCIDLIINETREYT